MPELEEAPRSMLVLGVEWAPGMKVREAASHFLAVSLESTALTDFSCSRIKRLQAAETASTSARSRVISSS